MSPPRPASPGQRTRAVGGEHPDPRPAAPRTALLVAQVRASLPAPPADLVDAGGGTGQVAVPLAAEGYHVTVLDPSAAMLATCTQRAAERGAGTVARLRTVQGDVEQAPALLGVASADAVLCIGVLEVAGEPGRALAALAGLLRPRGSLSLVVANRAWLALRAARRGDYAEALRLLDDPVVGGAPGQHGAGAPAAGAPAGAGQVTRAWTAAELRDLVSSAGLRTVAEYGLRVLGEPAEPDPACARAHAELERRLARLEPYRSVAEYVHLVASPSRQEA
jgi:S-adenosylmethionine-dependent methyltransferase